MLLSIFGTIVMITLIGNLAMIKVAAERTPLIPAE